MATTSADIKRKWDTKANLTGGGIIAGQKGYANDQTFVQEIHRSSDGGSYYETTVDDGQMLLTGNQSVSGDKIFTSAVNVSGDCELAQRILVGVTSAGLESGEKGIVLGADADRAVVTIKYNDINNPFSTWGSDTMGSLGRWSDYGTLRIAGYQANSLTFPVGIRFDSYAESPVENIGVMSFYAYSGSGGGSVVPTSAAAYMFWSGTSTKTLQINGDGSSIFHDNLNVSGSEVVQGTLDVSGATVLGSTLTVNSSASFLDNIGICIPNPDSKLVVSGAGQQVKYDTSTGLYHKYSIDNTAFGYIGDANNLAGGTITDFTIRAQNNLIFAIGSSEKVRVDSSGNLAVGTTSAGSKLHIVDGGTAISPVAGTVAVFQRNPSTDAGSYVSIIGGNSTGLAALHFGDADDDDIGMIRYLNNNDSMQFYTSATLAMTIDSSQNVGIGTDSSDGTLHVHTATAGTVSPITNADDLTVENSADAGISILCPNANSSRLVFGSPSDNDVAVIKADYNGGSQVLQFQVAGSEKMRINSDGYVGILETSPDTPLHITVPTNSGTDYSNKTIKAQQGISTGDVIYSKLAMYDGAVYGADIGLVFENPGYDLVFSTNDDATGNPTRIMTLQGKSGNIGINEINPSAKLTVNGTYAVSGTSTFGDDATFLVSKKAKFGSSSFGEIYQETGNGQLTITKPSGNILLKTDSGDIINKPITDGNFIVSGSNFEAMNIDTTNTSGSISMNNPVVKKNDTRLHSDGHINIGTGYNNFSVVVAQDVRGKNKVIVSATDGTTECFSLIMNNDQEVTIINKGSVPAFVVTSGSVDYVTLMHGTGMYCFEEDGDLYGSNTSGSPS